MADFNIADLKDLGLGIVAIFVLYLLFRSQITFTAKIVQDNTKAINKLSSTLSRNDIRDEEFRKELRKDISEIHEKVTDIHEKVV